MTDKQDYPINNPAEEAVPKSSLHAPETPDPRVSGFPSLPPATADPQTQTGAPAISVSMGVGVASFCFMLCLGMPNSSMLLLRTWGEWEHTSA